jgi:GGDEF domain-containing protein
LANASPFSGDFLARLGGDEFGVLAPGADELGIRRLVGRLGDTLPEGIFCSIGTATWDRIENASDAKIPPQLASAGKVFSVTA